MNLFQQIANSKITGSAPYIEPGTYLKVIENVVFKPDGHKGVSMSIEFIVLEAIQTDPENPPNPVGSRSSRTWNFTKNPDVAKPNSKAFMLAALGLGESQVTPEELGAAMQKACGPEQPLRGVLIRNVTAPWLTNAGTKLKAVDNFKNVPQEKVDVQTRRKAIEDGSIYDQFKGTVPAQPRGGFIADPLAPPQDPGLQDPARHQAATQAESTSVDDLFGKYQ
jgi:hypothetical protein